MGMSGKLLEVGTLRSHGGSHGPLRLDTKVIQ
jgi:hypothetical protein